MKATPLEILEMMVESFQQLDPEEEAEVRKAICEASTAETYVTESRWIN
jgi:hypothetical protein